MQNIRGLTEKLLSLMGVDLQPDGSTDGLAGLCQLDKKLNHSFRKKRLQGFRPSARWVDCWTCWTCWTCGLDKNIQNIYVRLQGLQEKGLR